MDDLITKNKRKNRGKIPTSIALTPEHALFIKLNEINLSGLIRDVLNDLIKKQSTTNGGK